MKAEPVQDELLPDVAEFLKTTRRIVREIELLEVTEGIEAYRGIIQEATKKLISKANGLIGEDGK